jgi:UDP-N-acetylglucosamine 2-epimerase (non-hydrolysing)
MTIVGTRPELVRLSRVIPRLDETCDHVLVHTGQNADPRLKDVFFNDLRLRQPDHYLDCDTSSLGAMIGDIFVKVERLLQSDRPDLVLILGDTNSVLSAIIAKRMGVHVLHLEAGNRAFDDRVPEEVNRRIVDAVADINGAYAEHARRNLLASGYPANRIYLTGSPMREVLDYYRVDIARSSVLDDLNLDPDGYFVLSLHREENVDSRDRLMSLLRGAEAVGNAYGLPVIASTHPRTRKRLDALGIPTTVQLMEPFGFFDYVALQECARCVISDSGTISEEATILGFPAVTPRESMERPEALDTGGVVLAGITPDGILDAVRTAVNAGLGEIPHEYQVLNFSQRVTNIVMSAGLWW